MGLSKNTMEVLCRIYNIYLSRCQSGIESDAAIYFDFNDYTSDKILSQKSETALHQATTELSNSGCIKMYTDGGFALEQSTIELMERIAAKHKP